MGLVIIKGRSGRGKTRALFNRLKESIGNKEGVISVKRYLIVPDQYSYSMERKVLENFPPSTVFNIQVMGFSMLSQRILETAGGIKRKVISNVGRSVLIRRIIRENIDKLTVYKEIAEKNGFEELVGNAIKEFKTYGRRPEDILKRLEALEEGELRNKLQDLHLIYASYEEVMSTEFTDGEDRMEIATEKFKEAFRGRDVEFFIDSFTDFTPLQLRMIREMMEVTSSSGRNTYVTLTLDDDTSKEHKGPFTLPFETEEKLSAVAQQLGIMAQREIVADNEGRFRHRELSILEKHYYDFRSDFTTRQSTDAIRIVRAGSPHEEMEFLVKDIIRRVRDDGFRFRDIAVLMRDVEDYETDLNAVMEEFDIPVFTDRRRDIVNNPLFAYLQAMSDILETDFSRDSVNRLLKTGLTSVEFEDACIFENYTLENGIDHEAYFWEEFRYSMSYRGGDLETKDALKKVNLTRRMLIEPMRTFLRNLEEGTDIRSQAGMLYDFLSGVEGEGVLGRYENLMDEIRQENPEKYEEFRQTADSLMDVLDEMVSISGDRRITAAEFLDDLLTGLRSVKVATVPATLDEVMVGDVSRIRASEARIVYIVGVNDGVFPRKATSVGIFTQEERRQLIESGFIISEESRERIINEEYYAYAAVTSASELLTLSYPSQNRVGESLRPSSIINRLKEIFRYLDIENYESAEDDDIVTATQAMRLLAGQMRRYTDGREVDSQWKGIYSYLNEDSHYRRKLTAVRNGIMNTNAPAALKAENMEKLFGDRINLTVSRAETYNKCPYSYFIRYGLNAGRRKEHVPERYDSGNLRHEVIDQFTRIVNRDGLDWENLSDEFIRENVRKLITRTVESDENSVFLSTSQLKYLSERIEKSLKTSLWTISSQIRKGQYRPMDSEVVFAMGEKIPPLVFRTDSGKEVVVSGKIDRVDILRLKDELYTRIIDYKSSNRDIAIDEVLIGIQIQLLVYLDVILRNRKAILELLGEDTADVSDEELLPGGIFYSTLQRPLISIDGKRLEEEEIERKILKDSRLSGLVLNDLDVIDSMDLKREDLVTKVHITKEGSFGQTEKYVLSLEDFRIMRSYAELIIREMADRLMSGEIPITPYRNGNITACRYCDFRSVCRFDPGVPENRYRNVGKRNKNENILIMKERLGGYDNEVD